MKLGTIIFASVIVAALVMSLGCTKNYTVIQPLGESIDSGENCFIGEIKDELPLDMDPEDKPTQEHIDLLKSAIMEELAEKDLFNRITMDPGSERYEVSGAIVEFKRGSGWIRALIGFGVGSAKLTVYLELYDTEAKNVLFSANFKQTVSSYMESGDETFRRVAKDFAKALEDQIENLKE